MVKISREYCISDLTDGHTILLIALNHDKTSYAILKNKDADQLAQSVQHLRCLLLG